MLCERPLKIVKRYKLGDKVEIKSWVAPCGKCPACLMRKAKEWTSRIKLEASVIGESNCSFVTLTYDDKFLPSDNKVSVRELQLYLKRLRKSYDQIGRKFRYFGVGEYGSQTHRPHYHLILLGVAPSEVDMIFSAWRRKVDDTYLPIGGIEVDECTPASIAYVCGYVSEKRANPNVFQIMSKGLGSPALPYFDKVKSFFADEVPTSYKSNGRTFGIGRYLKKKLEKDFGIERDFDEYFNFVRNEIIASYHDQAFLSTYFIDPVKSIFWIESDDNVASLPLDHFTSWVKWKNWQSLESARRKLKYKTKKRSSCCEEKK